MVLLGLGLMTRVIAPGGWYFMPIRQKIERPF